MITEKHDLVNELPEHKETIHLLKMENAHFAKLFEAYHKVDKEVHRIEDNIETPSDEYTNQRKAERLALKDEMFKMIIQHKSKNVN